MHLNIHYLFPKLNEIKFFIDQNSNIDVLGFCETFINDYFADSELYLKNYLMFRKDRQSNGGGIIVYVKNNYPCWQRKDLESDNLETIWLEVKPNKQKSYLFCYVYRPPSSLVSWNPKLFKLTLQKAYSENKSSNCARRL